MLATDTATLEQFTTDLLDDAGDDTWLILADWLEDHGQGDNALRVRLLLDCRAKATMHKATGVTTDLWSVRNRLMDRSGLAGIRLWAILCVRFTPLEDGRTVWDLLTDGRSRKAIVTAELCLCCLATQADAKKAADAADAAYADADAAYTYAATYAAAATATAAADAATAAAYAYADADAAATYAANAAADATYATYAATYATYANAAADATYAADAAADATYAATDAAARTTGWAASLAEKIPEWLKE